MRQAAGGRWTIDGAGGDASAGPPPEPPPVTTIAWRIGHIGLTFIGFGDRLFGAGTITVDDVPVAGSAAAAVSFLTRSYHDYWRDKFADVGADRWWQPIGPAFGRTPPAARPTWPCTCWTSSSITRRKSACSAISTHTGQICVLAEPSRAHWR